MAMRGTWTDDQVDAVIARILRIGVVTAAVLVLAGGILYIARTGGEPAEYGKFTPQVLRIRDVSGVVKTAMEGESRAIILLGLFVLIATPVVRVGFAAWAFLRQRDTAFVVISLVVLGILAFSLLRGGI